VAEIDIRATYYDQNFKCRYDADVVIDPLTGACPQYLLNFARGSPNSFLVIDKLVNAFGVIHGDRPCDQGNMGGMRIVGDLPGA